MELVITEKEDDNSVKFRCDLCNYNPYQAWCKGNTARFHAALMKHKQTARHREAEAFARGEQPVSISKEGVVSSNNPEERPPHFYISKLETMIDKLNDRIDALNNLYEGSEMSEENNPKKVGSLVGDFPPIDHFPENSKKWGLVGSLVDDFPPIDHFPENSKKWGLTVQPALKVADRPFQFKEIELKALRKFGDGSFITNTNALNAVLRCMNWCEVFIKDKERRECNVLFLKRTADKIKAVCGLMAEGWRIDDDDVDEIGERLDEIIEYTFTTS